MICFIETQLLVFIGTVAFKRLWGINRCVIPCNMDFFYLREGVYNCFTKWSGYFIHNCQRLQ